MKSAGSPERGKKCSAEGEKKKGEGKGKSSASPRGERATKDDGSVHAGVTANVPNSHFVITLAAIRSRLIYRGPSIIPPFRPFHLAVRRHLIGT